ncbi:putative ferric-chelate reductase 1 [Heteronotia binoei]|uniref:putative ferric-chelate reductase 1 n=1 Tax=Heteronotia binoei TaxID=13085 RepID=UPI00292DE586|nr:putative ferric-chelate reductase 1 [Heteronotia binoei]
MKRYLFFTFLLCGVFAPEVLSLSHRNISLACESMLPDHSVEPQESESPYHISVSSDEYDPGREVKVNIEGTPDVGFKWFMLQARDIEENIPVGSFQITDANTQGLDCFNLSNSALIQTNLEEKQTVTAHWVSPDAKTIQFIATIFQDPETYWVVVPSVVLFPRNSSESADDSKTGGESQSAQVSPKSRKKSAGITLRINCGQGGSYASSSECTKIYQGSPSGTYSSSQGGVVYQGGTKKGGCLGGGVSSVYSKYGCRDVSFLGVLVCKGGPVPLAQPLLLSYCPVLSDQPYFLQACY